ncbi:MAG: DUF3078 domain-containing protein [Saprospiraceae bacterium]|nr:DUF3078 domain-containing protein [Saprospiraceae bacterium]
MKKVFLATCLCLTAWTMGAQTLDELKTMKAEKEKMAASKQAEADAIKGEIADLDSKITVLSGWKTGLFGAVGFNFNQSNNWQTNAIKNSTSASFSGSLSVFANRQAEKYFWNNSGNFNLGYLKFDDEDIETDDADFRRSTDVLRFASLYGYKLNKGSRIGSPTGCQGKGRLYPQIQRRHFLVFYPDYLPTICRIGSRTAWPF